jgi:hypothetical protein
MDDMPRKKKGRLPAPRAQAGEPWENVRFGKIMLPIYPSFEGGAFRYRVVWTADGKR